jgi:SMC interacting uncharacterized protein involved in chromosome segregation
MSLEQLMGRYFRLTQELAIARKAQPWQTGLMARLAKELMLVEREITALRSPRQPLPNAMPHAA